jgi:glutamate-1-semialdehyde aminotransferase
MTSPDTTSPETTSSGTNDAGMTNAALFARSCEVIPGGVNSSIRAFRAVGGTPYLVDRAEGPYVWDVEGTRYIDLVQSYGAIILGHAHPAILKVIGRVLEGRRADVDSKDHGRCAR